MPKVYINGKLYNYAAGIPKGDPDAVIVFIHGAGGNHTHWLYQTSSLGNQFLCLAVDLPGHGLSEGQASDSIKEYADFVHDFIEHVAGGPVFLAGHSMGGAIAMEFGLCFPDKLSGLILIGTGARLRVAQPILETFGAGKHFLSFTDYAYGSGTPPELLQKAKQEMLETDPLVFYNDLTACNNFDIMERISDIRLPTLVLGASDDRLTPLKYSRYLAENIINSRLEIIEGSGHMMMLEKPSEVNSHIEQFVKSVIES